MERPSGKQFQLTLTFIINLSHIHTQTLSTQVVRLSSVLVNSLFTHTVYQPIAWRQLNAFRHPRVVKMNYGTQISDDGLNISHLI